METFRWFLIVMHWTCYGAQSDLPGDCFMQDIARLEMPDRETCERIHRLNIFYSDCFAKPLQWDNTGRRR